jgi:hypothetical protein
MNRNRMLFAASGVPIVMLFLISQTSWSQAKPTVISTDPVNGAIDVSPNLVSVVVTFSKPMVQSGSCAATSASWITPQGNICAWSLDKKSMTITRYGTSLPALATGSTIAFYLNGFGTTSLRDTDGNALDPYTLSFTIGTAKPSTASFSKIEANPSKGFSWPYYLRVPATVKEPAFLIVEPNNTGTVSDDPAVHDAAARNESQAWATNMENLGCPHLIPTFSRPASNSNVYTQALDRNTLLTKLPGLERIDLQLLAMIDDARGRLAAANINVDSRVFMFGASASGQFASRFVMLHPDRVKAASIGSPMFGPIVPVAQWNGQTLPYHIGISDLEQLVGKKFDVDSFRQVPLQIYVGDLDTNIVPWFDPVYDPDSRLVEAAFGGSGPENVWRWANFESAYGSVQSSSQFVVIPGMGHTWPPWSYMRDFFERNRVTPAPPPAPRPLLFTLYFPHAACVPGWQTEIAILNTGEGTSVTGELKAYSDRGTLVEAMGLVIPPAGRREIAVCSAFRQTQDIAYLAFVSDYAFIGGYTRFTQPSGRATLPASSGAKHGWFPKMEQDGWTGVAFVNVDTAATTVTLTAYDDEGSEVAEEPIDIRAGEKVVAIVTQLFHADISRARYFKYSAGKKVLGFTVSQSADGLLVDGIGSLPEFFSYLQRQK